MTTQSNIQYAWYENSLFRFRGLILVLSVLATVFFAYRASFVRPDTRLERLIPGSHAFVQNARQFLGSEQVGGSSVIRVAVERKNGTIFDYNHLVTLQQISDALSLMDGVNTQSLNSLWAPGMLWFAVTPAGFDSGPVIKNETFADSPASMDEIRTNVLRAGIVGSYVSNDFKASMIDFEVLPISPKTRQPLDTNDFADRLEKLRQKYQTDDLSIHIIGDVKKIADLVNGFGKIALFFLGALAITAALLFQYSRCLKSTLAPAGLFDRCRDLAAGCTESSRLRAGRLLRPGALSGVRHCGQPRGAGDQCIRQRSG
jgi:predicted RND superfamily exporter protein